MKLVAYECPNCPFIQQSVHNGAHQSKWRLIPVNCNFNELEINRRLLKIYIYIYVFIYSHIYNLNHKQHRQDGRFVCVYLGGTHGVYALEYLKIGPAYCMKKEQQVYVHCTYKQIHTGQTWCARTISLSFEKRLISRKQRELHGFDRGSVIFFYIFHLLVLVLINVYTLFLSVREQFDCGMREIHTLTAAAHSINNRDNTNSYLQYPSMQSTQSCFGSLPTSTSTSHSYSFLFDKNQKHS